MQPSTATQDRATPAIQTDSYRLIVLDPTGTAMLLELSGKQPHLPQIRIPRFTRPAYAITEFVRNVWAGPSVFLFSGLLEAASNSDFFAVLESADGFGLSPEGMEWFPVHFALSNLAISVQERQAIEAAYTKATDRIHSQGPFCTLGWMKELRNWVDTIIRPLGIESKTFTQWNACETFSLVRFDTTRHPVWFKAVGEPNLHEFEISQTLAELMPDFIPTVLGTRPECHGWLMSDEGAVTLDEINSSTAWQSAATTLADLQIGSTGITSRLLKAGCRDLRVAALLDMVDPFFEVMDGLMKQQTNVPPAILSSYELSNLSSALKDALHCLHTLQIPNTLGHSDFNPGNILVESQCCVFIDWAEAYVGHPFLTFEYLMSHLRRGYPELLPLETDLRCSYAKRWSNIVSAQQVAEAFLFSPFVAVFAYAASGGSWCRSERLKIPQAQTYLRSLTRRMKQEADLLQRRRVECPV